jgi:hypothetical protein
MSKKAIKDVDIHVGAVVRERRLALSLTQQNLAEAIWAYVSAGPRI